LDPAEQGAPVPLDASRRGIRHLQQVVLTSPLLAAAGLLVVYCLCVAAWMARGWAPLSPDDGLYLIVGTNVLEGFGPTRAGHLFVSRSPLYAILLALPGRLGFPMVEAPHLVNVGWLLLGATVSGLLAKRLWGWGAGILAACLPLALPLIQDLGPSLRIDILAGLLVMLLALISTSLGGSVRWWWIALAAGIVLGLAVLVKETMLVFAGLPIAVPMVLGRPTALILRDAATAAAAALLTMSWWLVWHLQLVGATPYVRVPPLALAAVLVLSAIWLSATWLRRDRLDGHRVSAGPSPIPVDTVPRWVPWLIALGWSLLVVLGAALRSKPMLSTLLGASPAELLGTIWQDDGIALLLLAIGLSAAILSVRDRTLAVPALGLAAAVPLAWLTLALQNGVRNFLPAVFLAAAAAAGLVAWSLTHLQRGPRRRRAWEGQALASTGLAVAMVGILLAGPVRGLDQRGPGVDEDLARFAADTQRIAPAGASILVSYRVADGFEVFTGRRYELQRIPFRRVRLAPRSPNGLSVGLEGGGVLALGLERRRQQIIALQPEAVGDAARAADYLVYGGNHHRNPRALTELLGPSTGFTRVLQRPLGGAAIVELYEVDDASVELRGQPVASDPITVGYVVPAILEASDPRGEAAIRCLFRYGLWIRGLVPPELERTLSELRFTGRQDGEGTLYTGPPPEPDCRPRR